MNHQSSSIFDLFMSTVELTKPCAMLWNDPSLDLEYKLIFLTYQARDISSFLTPNPRLHVHILRHSGQHLQIFPRMLPLIFKDFLDASTCIEQFNNQIFQVVYTSLS